MEFWAKEEPIMANCVIINIDNTLKIVDMPNNIFSKILKYMLILSFSFLAALCLYPEILNRYYVFLAYICAEH